MQFLFERLAEPPSFDGSQTFDLRAAVAAQIQRLVSARTTRVGGDLDLLDFGSPSVVDIALDSKPQLELYAQRLARLVARYEPRLKSPRVRIEASSETLRPYRLAIYGTLDHSNGVDVFHFELPSH
ncbi:type VI secretion system baseplate subunit TssE [Burkholderia plantarii]|uniref:type VI secretion system baseplate subunit TssE n=1 Tax=Burkholderia plantarii TaxID=41899 RepID=UPI0018DCBD24|nr:type VI secretion system baseplate subunit TssE [Burkholderia plantarii]MBI0329098.1 type VI secretion system baseplate subunit TssE [Burkholderia plantarii]